MMYFSLLENSLFAAVRSAKRIRGHPVHPTTAAHWAKLLLEARAELRRDQAIGDRTMLQKLVSELEDQVRQSDT